MVSLPRKLGRYRVIDSLGSGSMARVYLAEDLLLGREVAVKVIKASPDLRADEKERVLARFVREYQVTAALDHPNVVTIFDVGEHEGEPFIAMEYVRGPTLEELLSEQAPMTAGQAFDLFVPIADALDHAHRQDIVHRDLKPTNVLLTEVEVPKVSDFGLAKVASTTVLTRASSIVGTPAYMSPEQVTGHEMSGASDQFALATILYRALSGERPFTGNTATTIMYKIVNEDPVAPHHINRLLPQAVSGVLLRGLSKNAGDRFTTCRDLVQAVIRALQADTEPPSPAETAPRGLAEAAGSEETAAVAGAPAPDPAAKTAAKGAAEPRDAAGKTAEEEPPDDAGRATGSSPGAAGWLDRVGLGRLGGWVRRRLTSLQESEAAEDRPVDHAARTAVDSPEDTGEEPDEAAKAAASAPTMVTDSVVTSAAEAGDPAVEEDTEREADQSAEEVDVAAKTVRMRRPRDED